MADSQKNNRNHPKNIGIIMDGNGRWANANKLKVTQGHEKGVGVVRDETITKHHSPSLQNDSRRSNRKFRSPKNGD